jgi:histidyl-tRNA synthetase
MTPTVSRMVAARRQELAYPLRLYSIPNLWRYERPQRGRMREHWQLNVDLFGVSGVEAELEMIELADQIYKAYGATSDMYEIRLNSRKFMNFILSDYLGFSEKSTHAMSKLIDRMHKLSETQFITIIDSLLSNEELASRGTEKLLEVLNSKNIDDLPSAVRQEPALKQLSDVISNLKKRGINNARFDITLMRGFDYYTDIVFEVFDTHPDNNRSMMGGGRYDGLVGLFGVPPLPTVGFGLGDATLANFLEIHGLLPNLPVETDVYAVLIGEVNEAAEGPISELRKLGLNVAVDYSGRKIGDQLKSATKKGIARAVIIGQDELSSEAYSLKDLNTGEDQKLSVQQIADVVQKSGRD